MQPNIIAKPQLPQSLRKISILEALFTQTAQGIYPYILVPRHIYEDLSSPAPNPYYLALIVHEQTHLDRQSRHGWIKWMVSYAFSATFRFREEIEAIRAQMRYLKRQGLRFPIESTAKLLSGWLYLKPVSYDTALKELHLAWEEA